MIITNKKEYIRRGTTPSVVFHLQESFPIDSIKSMYATFVNGNTILEYDKDDVVLDAENHTVTVNMTQEQTLSLDDRYGVSVQLRFVMFDGTAPATKIKTYDVERILKDGVIE